MAGKDADFVRQRFQPSTQALAGIYVFKHQLLVPLDEARVTVLTVIRPLYLLALDSSREATNG